MTCDKAADFYQPLIGGADKMLRRPIRPWRMSETKLLLRGIESREVDFSAVAVALNKLALLEAYEGQHANALALCDAQIAFWKNVADDRGDKRLLAYAIQPMINIVRLERWTATADGPVSLYGELSPDKRASCGPLQARHGLGLSFAQLCAVNDMLEYDTLITNVYWREYSRFLLQSGRTAALRALLEQGLNLPLHPYVRIALLEVLLLQQARAGNYESASRLLARMKISSGSAYRLPFKVLEMYLAAKTQAPTAPALVREVMQAVCDGVQIQPNAHGLNLLFDITKVFRELAADAEEAELLGIAGRIAAELDDEVIQFDVLDRLKALNGSPHAAWQQAFGQSTYASIRKRLGLAHPAPDLVSTRLMQATQRLVQLDYAACIHLLDSTATAVPAIPVAA
jgi:hypothetical protein